MDTAVLFVGLPGVALCAGPATTPHCNIRRHDQRALHYFPRVYRVSRFAGRIRVALAPFNQFVSAVSQTFLRWKA
jgi:hypothetical protein